MAAQRTRPSGPTVSLRLCPPAGDGGSRPEAGGESEPGERIGQVGVAEADHGQAADRQAAGVRRGVGVDEVGRDRAVERPAAAMAATSREYQRPAAGSLRAQEAAAGLAERAGGR